MTATACHYRNTTTGERKDAAELQAQGPDDVPINWQLWAAQADSAARYCDFEAIRAANRDLGHGWFDTDPTIVTDLVDGRYWVQTRDDNEGFVVAKATHTGAIHAVRVVDSLADARTFIERVRASAGLRGRR